MPSNECFQNYSSCTKKLTTGTVTVAGVSLSVSVCSTCIEDDRIEKRRLERKDSMGPSKFEDMFFKFLTNPKTRTRALARPQGPKKSANTRAHLFRHFELLGVHTICPDGRDSETGTDKRSSSQLFRDVLVEARGQLYFSYCVSIKPASNMALYANVLRARRVSNMLSFINKRLSHVDYCESRESDREECLNLLDLLIKQWS